MSVARSPLRPAPSMLIDLQFTPRNAELVRLGLKRATTRRTEHGRIGAEFLVGGARYMIVAIIPMQLWRCAEETFFLEGESSPQYFLAEWCRCYGTSVEVVDVHQTVFVHVFRPALAPPGVGQ